MASFITAPLLLSHNKNRLFRTKTTTRYQSFSRSPALLSARDISNQDIRNAVESTKQDTSRRDFLFSSLAVAAASILPVQSSIAAASQNVKLGEKIVDPAYGFAFQPPASGWTKNVTAISSGRRATIFVRDEDGDSNISMVSTPVAGDYMKLASFGSVDNVAKTIVPPKKSDIDGTLISSSTDVSKNAYIFEYTITADGVTRHLITVFSLRSGECLNTLTGQAIEEKWPAAEAEIRAVVDSYQLL